MTGEFRLCSGASEAVCGQGQSGGAPWGHSRPSDPVTLLACQALTAEIVKTIRDIIALNPLYRSVSRGQPFLGRGGSLWYLVGRDFSQGYPGRKPWGGRNLMARAQSYVGGASSLLTGRPGGGAVYLAQVLCLLPANKGLDLA